MFHIPFKFSNYLLELLNADHIHLLTGFPSTLAIATLVKQIKGSLSRAINYQIRPSDFFKWQGSYATFTINHQDLNPIVSYIHRQVDRHQQQTHLPSWEISLLRAVCLLIFLSPLQPQNIPRQD